MFEISSKAFENFKNLLYAEAGIVLSDEKMTMVANRLSRRLRLHSMKDYDEYFRYVKSDKGHKDGEFQHVIDRLTTHKTYFFRESQHFDLLKSELLQTYRNKPLRIWSAACSSGEEVYTLCILLSEVLGNHADWSIFGSDISQTELNYSRQGEYTQDQVDNLSKHHLDSYFTKTETAGKPTYKVSNQFKKHVDFGCYNLISDGPKTNQFDIVFIRNVLIYFDVDKRKLVLDKMVQSIKPGGYLFTGRSETVINLIKQAEIVQPSVFRKKTD